MRIVSGGIVACLLWLGGTLAGHGLLAEEARPNADEECVMQCDDASDKCMRAASGDEEKAKACDDQYIECLKKCR